MITCNRCGKAVPAGAAQCQNCGQSVTQTTQGGGGPVGASRGSAPNQPELPAWLGTLRAGEKPMPSPTGSSPFSAADLVNKGSLPAWMQPGREEPTDTGPSGAYPAQSRRPASTSAPNTDSAFLPAKGMDASSLIDQQALPSWLQAKEQQVPTPQPQQPQYPPQDNIAASSLVQADSLPVWMRSMQPQPSNAPAAPLPIPSVGQYNQPAVPAQPFSASDLIDREAIPQWMATQNPSAPIPPVANGQPGMAASMLIDPNALPPWLREGSKEQQAGGMQAMSPAYPTQPANLTNLTQPAQTFPNQPSNGSAMQPTTNGNLAASSFIDVDALPAWLRPPGEQPSSASAPLPHQWGGEGPRKTSFGAPVRIDTIVPSRPRAETSMHEESEVAANVFASFAPASMLGVASAAPARDAAANGQRTQVSPQQAPQSQSGLQPPVNNGATNGMGMPPNMPQVSMPMATAPTQAGYAIPQPIQPQTQGYTPGLGNYQQGQGSYAPVPQGGPMGSMPGMTGGLQPSANQAPVARQAPQTNMSEQAKPETKRAWRGRFEAIRDFFFRN